ncbi:histidine kinase [Chitinophaga horti]|uniref:Histidine kinase n=1 Tax=Chitinophaga horti TaxID=2920382 RepID=A0ABY6J3I1_9BACT|nr:histidine kinase [Chitinophaga horti]UYQ92747.1 histidine kinase [Chitinophaga horti]
MPPLLYTALIGLLLAALAWLALLCRRYRRKYQSEAMLNYFATSLYGKNTVEDVLWDVAKNCISQLRLEDCVIYVLDETKQRLIQKAAYGPKNPARFEIHDPIEIRVGRGIVGAVAATGKAEIIGDTTRDARYILDDEQRFSEITVPIFLEGRVFGIIDSEHSQKYFYTAEHLSLLEKIAAICAVKIGKTIAEEKAQQREKEVQLLHKQLSELRLVSLKSQMNPHFLFNCLNGIYNCILTNQVDKATAYVSNFAKLLRMVLMHAEKNFIPLQEEISLLQHYLNIESLRVDKTFQYNILVEEPIDAEAHYVPGMLIQPFLENAIWHGLMFKEGSRMLHINWRQPEDHILLCEIIDNGVGRAKSAQLRTNGLKQGAYQSRGMQLCYERVELYKALFNTHFSIDVYDLYDDDGNAEGTKVHISFNMNEADATPVVA